MNDPALAKFRPYLKYHHSDSVTHPRPHHVSWDGLVLPKDHPFWKTHATPNGWGCRCWITAAGPKDYEAAKAAGKTEPPEGWDAIDSKTGAPVGIDKGWAYNPGASRAEELRRFALNKAASLPPQIGKAFAEDAAKVGAGRDLPAFLLPASYVGAVGDSFRESLDRGLSTIPDKVRQAAAASGWHVVGGPTLIDIAPRLANSIPGGVPPGATWEHLDGIAMPTESMIGVAETSLLLSGRRVSTTAARVGELLRHEHGHVLDTVVISASTRKDFLAAYNADCVALKTWRGRLGGNDDAGRDIEKLVGDDGPREAFADLFAEMYGGGTAASIIVSRAMPRTFEVVRKIVEEWLK